ncbi:MAG: 3-hydroxyacyl-CoA dehydrogenase family protein [Synergistaceae bacterium]|jgi:3-hydroxybutyryl-CoA dehydrogenase|nr:3-hydroxyacyl-CoA dehydrogenase family protein [Synergistaceae bacterium]
MENADRDAVVVAGSGLMGVGIAAVSALAGNRTVLFNRLGEKAERARKDALAQCRELLDNELTTPEAAGRAEELLSGTSDLEGVLPRARWVIEAIVENLETKQDLFAWLDDRLPADVPILSNTSGLRISDIAAKMKRPERAVTAHFWFPAHLVPLVEVVVGDKSSIDVAVAVRDELERWGKAPVLVKRDLPGQLGNRILQAVIREAVNIVEMGLASPEDVDRAVKTGMGIRFPVWGPLEHVDAVGIDLCASVQDTVLPAISARTEAAPLMRDLLAEGNLGHKTGKGIYDWSVKDMNALRQLRNDFIIHALKKIRASKSP